MVIDGRGCEFVVKVSFFVVKCILQNTKLHFTDVLCISWTWLIFSNKKSPTYSVGPFTRTLYENEKITLLNPC